jgi:hypothetical protein
LKPVRENSTARPYLEKTFHNKGLVEWLKVQALSSNSSTTKKAKRVLSGCLAHINLSSMCKALGLIPNITKRKLASLDITFCFMDILIRNFSF